MLQLWSSRHKFNTWRRIWLAVAEAQHELGLPVTREQVEELRAVVERKNPDGTVGITDDEIRLAEKYERDLRHDVMAHVHALGDSCPKAKGIIHLGMTSQDVVCNADLMTIRRANTYIENKIARLLITMSAQAGTHKGLPTLAFTHYQPAQPTTVGRRLAMWAADLGLTLERLSRSYHIALRGLRGATGTQASYLALLNDDALSVDLLEARAIERMSGQADSDVLCDEKELERRRSATIRFLIEQEPFPVSCSTEAEWRNYVSNWQQKHKAEADLIAAMTQSQYQASLAIEANRIATFAAQGQTYPRVIDTFILADLASTASVLHKIATDIRLLCNRKEIDEPFETKQIGSSAMPYKRNPMRCERICGLARFVMNLVGNAYDTAATQWLERTLDDSSNRRLSLPEAFLALDGALDLMHNVASGLIVHEAMVKKNLMAELPFMATENILMACVKLGGDRQHYHEVIRVHAQAAGMRVKQEGQDNDLLERLKADKNFWSIARGGPLSAELDWEGVMDPMKYVGRSVEQTERFIKEVVDPMREQYAKQLAELEESGPRV
jgi:adenylosuccinate lyase